MARRRMADRIAALEARRTVTGPVECASPEVSALAFDLIETYDRTQAPGVLAHRRALARRIHDLLPVIL